MRDINDDERQQLHAAIAEVGAPEEDWLLSEWVVVAAWVSPEDGTPFLVRVGSHMLTDHHRSGLLFEGLHGEWAGDDE